MKYKKLIFIITAVVILSLLGVCAVGYYRAWFGHHRILVKGDFKQLPGWEQDDHRPALEALQKSCVLIAKKKDPSKFFSNSMPQSGKVEEWQKICVAIESIDKVNTLTVKEFFESWFLPYQVSDNFNTEGLFTGYYLPTLNCSLKPTERYTVPIYAIPDDLVKVDLGLFDDALKGRTLVGQVKNNKMTRYPKKAEIVKGSISKNAKILAWCDDKVEVAFAHIQGSAIVRLADDLPSANWFSWLLPLNFNDFESWVGNLELALGVSKKIYVEGGLGLLHCQTPRCEMRREFLVNYDASNGREYVGIGKFMVKNGYLPLEHSSMQDIRAWISQHPDKADFILNQNASYVFFRVLENLEPLGAQQAPLTPGRSLAVDKRYIPLGAPIWLDTTFLSDASQETVSFQHLLIAQDTGGAIKGVVRGDVYWGAGERAAFIAGHMKNKGRYWILLPRNDVMER